MLNPDPPLANCKADGRHLPLSGLSILPVCQACPAGLTTLAAGAESAAECVCPSGNFTNPLPPAVLHWNPSLADENMGGTAATGYTSPAANWNIATNGGFTIIMKMKITDSSDRYAAIFHLADPSTTAFYLRIGRNEWQNTFILENTPSCNSEWPHLTFTYGVVYTIVYTYDASSQKKGFYYSDSPTFSRTCPQYGADDSSCEISSCTGFSDYTDLSARIGSRHETPGQTYNEYENNAMAGSVYGVYGYDKVLTDAQIQTVIDSIVVDGEDDARVLHGGACTACQAGLTTLAPGANSSDACVCQSGSHQVGDLVSFFPLDGNFVDDLSSATMVSSSTAYHTDAAHGPVLNANGNVYTITSPALGTVLDASAFTVSFWIYFVSLPSNDHSNILTRWDNYDAPYSATGGFLIMTTHSKRLKLAASSQEHESPTTLQESRWYHVSVVKASSSSIELYLDGVLDVRWDATTRAMLNPINDMGIGSYCYSSSASSTSATCTTETNNAMFYLMDLRFYSRALSASEAAVLATRADHQGDVCASCSSKNHTPTPVKARRLRPSAKPRPTSAQRSRPWFPPTTRTLQTFPLA